MSRLTKKIEDLDFYKISSAYINEIPNQFLDKDYVGEAINKLGKLENLEEHYGVPLNVLLKLLDQWSFYFPDGQNQVIYYFCLKRKEFYYKEYRDDDDLKGEVITVKFEDYKKFWFVNEDLSE